MTYKQIIFEIIASRETNDKPMVSMNSILKYFYDHFKDGNDNNSKNLLKKVLKNCVKEGLLKQKRDSFTFSKKEIDNIKPKELPIRDLIKHNN